MKTTKLRYNTNKPLPSLSLSPQRQIHSPHSLPSRLPSPNTHTHTYKSRAPTLRLLDSTGMGESTFPKLLRFVTLQTQHFSRPSQGKSVPITSIEWNPSLQKPFSSSPFLLLFASFSHSLSLLSLALKSRELQERRIKEALSTAWSFCGRSWRSS